MSCDTRATLVQTVPVCVFPNKNKRGGSKCKMIRHVAHTLKLQRDERKGRKGGSKVGEGSKNKYNIQCIINTSIHAEILYVDRWTNTLVLQSA